MNDQPDWPRLTPQNLSDFGGRYDELAPGASTLPLAPAFLLGHVRGAVMKNYFSSVDTLSVGCYQLQNVGVTSHSLLVWEGKPVLCDQLSMTRGSINETINYADLLVGEPFSRRIDEPVVSLLGPGYLVYGHWLVDILPKLYILSALGHDPLKLKYLIPADTPDFGLEWLRLVGIRDEQLIRFFPHSEVVGVSNLVLPTLLRLNSRAHSHFGTASDFLLSMIRRINPIPPHNPKLERLFVSRAKCGRDGRSLKNRDEVEGMAAHRGFAVVWPEQLSLLEQISLFSGARQLVGEYGSGLHGSIFAPPNASVCALRAAAFHPGFLQSGVCQARNQNIGYVFGETGVRDIIQEFTIEPPNFALALRFLELM